jgi:hypothetical protein
VARDRVPRRTRNRREAALRGCAAAPRSIAGTLVSRGLAAASASKRHSAQNVDRAVSQLQATTGPLRHPSAVEACRVSSRRLDRSRSVRLPVPWISICASRGDNEACSSCTSSFAPEPAYARGYRLSTRGGGAQARRAGRAVPCDQRASPFAWQQPRRPGARAPLPLPHCDSGGALELLPIGIARARRAYAQAATGPAEGRLCWSSESSQATGRRQRYCFAPVALARGIDEEVTASVQ